MAKTLIVYFSYTGNCKAIVNSLASQITADQLEIQPSEKGLRYEANNYALGTQLLNAITASSTARNLVLFISVFFLKRLIIMLLVILVV